MSSQKVHFTNASRELLISEVQGRPSLWNDRHPDYKKTEKTNKLWDEIGAVVGYSGSIAKAKWKNLKDKFRVELQKVPITRSGDEGNGYKPKWPFFDLMLFVKDTLLPSTTSGNLSNHIMMPYGNDSEDDSVENYNNEETTTDRSFSETPRSVSSNEFINLQTAPSQNKIRSRKRRAEDLSIDPYLEIEQKKLDLIREEQQKDSAMTNNPDYHFLMSLLPYFEPLNALEKLQLRSNMQNLVLEAYKQKEVYSSQGTTFNTVPNNYQLPVQHIDLPISNPKTFNTYTYNEHNI